MSSSSQLRVLSTCKENFIVPEVILRSRASDRQQVWGSYPFMNSVEQVRGSTNRSDIGQSEVTDLSGGVEYCLDGPP